jgi:hypothetical protein
MTMKVRFPVLTAVLVPLMRTVPLCYINLVKSIPVYKHNSCYKMTIIRIVATYFG